jgi:hypothetical protein
MNNICLDIFQAIHEGKWLSIEYKNGRGELTRYWIGIKSVNPKKKTLCVDGLHLSQYTVTELTVYIDSIQSSAVIDGSFFPVNSDLIRDIEERPTFYHNLFGNAANLKILSYLEDCSRLDTTPYKTEYALIDHLDGDWQEEYRLNEEQFKEIVKNFQYGAKNKNNRAMNCKLRQIAMNVLSINTKKGLYCLAYRKMRLNVTEHTLRRDEEIVICTEFTVNGNKYSIRNFLDAEDFELLDDFENNAELIKDKIQQNNPRLIGVDDMPYLLAIGRDVVLDLHSEYEAIHRMYEEDKVTIPLKAFFGDLLRPARRTKDYPIALIDNRINLDQLLAIHNAIKYPLAYIQGPPGTGKTNTIVNTIITAFFNDKTVLFASYNNHPIDGVFDKLKNIPYREKGFIPFPIIRLGNDEKVAEALEYMRRLYESTMKISIFDGTLERNKDEKTARTKKLSELLSRHEEKLELLERKEAIEKLMDENHHLTFQTSLQGVQLSQVNKQLEQIGEITDTEALKLVMEDEEEFKKYLYYTSAKYIKRINEPKNEDLRNIIYCEDRNERIKAFNTYIKKRENLKKFQRIFPIIATTSISAHKLGEPDTYFDMTIMDEASQGNIATSLVPIIRGQNLMLVGDPQQLSPVILLNPVDNKKLKKAYSVPDEYDYIKNSIYKTFLAADAVSGEILLSHHYRCNKKIIDFNNRKYYNNKLIINSQNKEATPLIFRDIPVNTTTYKNTAPQEVTEIIRYAKENPDKSIGVITPFANQKNLINEQLKNNGLTNVSCGTVHAFQGDEKDTVLFSLALTDKTGQATYEWLKNNRELINVATSRAKDRLIILSSKKELDRLHTDSQDDLYELVRYVQTKGNSEITPRVTNSRALGIKPYSTETEKAFLTTLNHALDNVLNTQGKCTVKKEVSISQVFNDNISYSDLFYTGRFDFVVYEIDYNKNELPILAIELDGREHAENEIVMERDRKKNTICHDYGFELIRVENTYARRYNYIKDVLIQYFNGVRRMR